MRAPRSINALLGTLEKFSRADDILMVWSHLPQASLIERMILYDGCTNSLNLEHRTSNHFASPYFEPGDHGRNVSDLGPVLGST